MSPRKPASWTCIALVAAALGGVAHAQPPGPSGAGGAGGHEDRHAELRREVFDQIRTMCIWKLTERLKLDERQIAKLFPLLSEFDEKERALARERHELVHRLKGALETERPPAGEITKLSDALLANRARRNVLDDERVRAMRRVLTPTQQGQLVLLWPKLEDEAKQQLREAFRRSRGDGQGPGEAVGQAAPASPPR